MCSARPAEGRQEKGRASSTTRSDRVKLVWWDGTGLVLLAKRLEGASFRWPDIEDGVLALTAVQLSALLEGLDWTRVRPREVVRPQVAA